MNSFPPPFLICVYIFVALKWVLSELCGPFVGWSWPALFLTMMSENFGLRSGKRFWMCLSTVSSSTLSQWICIVNDTLIGSVLYVYYVIYYMMVSRLLQQLPWPVGTSSLGEMCLMNWIFVGLVNWASFIDTSNVPDVWWLTDCLIIFDEFWLFYPFCAECGWCRTINNKECVCTSVV